MTKDPTRLPMVVIGGYLGAGKTTLVNRLLADPGIGRSAVLVNDFGDIDIDSSLIESHDGDTISLANGCVCCSLADGFVLALRRISDRADDFDRVVVEVSGVGDPWKVAQWGRTPGYQLDAVVVLADAETIIERSDDPYVGTTIRTQLEGADVVVISKSDLVDDTRLGAVRRWLSEATSAVTMTGTAATSTVLGFDAAEKINRGTQRSKSGHAQHTVATRRFPDALQRETFDAAMLHRPDGVVRVKGHVVFANDPDAIVSVQVVGQRVEVVRLSDGQAVVCALVAVAVPGTPIASVERWLSLLDG